MQRSVFLITLSALTILTVPLRSSAFDSRQSDEEVLRSFRIIAQTREEVRKEKQQIPLDAKLAEAEPGAGTRAKKEGEIALRRAVVEETQKLLRSLVFGKDTCEMLRVPQHYPTKQKPKALLSVLDGKHVWTYCLQEVEGGRSHLRFFVRQNLQGKLLHLYHLHGGSCDAMRQSSGRKLCELTEISLEDGKNITWNYEHLTDTLVNFQMVGHEIERLEFLDLRDSSKNRTHLMGYEEL